MSFNDYRDNDLAKYRSGFVSYGVDDIIGRTEIPAKKSFYNFGPVSGTLPLNLNNYNYFKINAVDSVNISGSHRLCPKINNFMVEITTAGSPTTITWDTWFSWSGGNVPDLTAAGTYLLIFNETNSIISGTLSSTECIGYLG